MRFKGSGILKLVFFLSSESEHRTSNVECTMNDRNVHVIKNFKAEMEGANTHIRAIQENMLVCSLLRTVTYVHLNI